MTGNPEVIPGQKSRPWKLPLVDDLARDARPGSKRELFLLPYHTRHFPNFFFVFLLFLGFEGPRDGLGHGLAVEVLVALRA